MLETTSFISPADAQHEVELVFEQLRNAIYDQQLPSGLQLKEQHLASGFGVNRAVVRQALAKLEYCKLAVHHPNRGAFVASLSSNEGKQIFRARKLIECTIVEELAEAITAEQRVQIEDWLDSEQVASNQGDTTVAKRLAMGFHLLLAQLAGNQVLGEFVEQLALRTPLVNLQGHNQHHCGNEDHQLIANAIFAGSTSKAAKLMAAHMLQLEKMVKIDAPQRAGKSDIGKWLRV